MENFFKPTISKIILFVLIFGIFVPFINQAECAFDGPDPSPTSYYSHGYHPIVSLLYYSIYSETPCGRPRFSVNYSYLIIGVIASYLVSCLIYTLIKRLKHKAERR